MVDIDIVRVGFLSHGQEVAFIRETQGTDGGLHYFLVNLELIIQDIKETHFVCERGHQVVP